jgi:hypothetical protein
MKSICCLGMLALIGPAITLVAQQPPAFRPLPTATETFRPSNPSVAPYSPTSPYARPASPRTDGALAGSVTLEMKGGSRLVGIPTKLTRFTLCTSFGDITFDLGKVEGIRIVGPPSGSGDDFKIEAVAVFRNGDVLSGKLKLETIELKALWGEASVDVKQLTSLVTTTDRVSWRNHGGWRIERNSGAGPPPVGTPGLSPAIPVPAGYPAAPSPYLPPATRAVPTY